MNRPVGTASTFWVPLSVEVPSTLGRQLSFRGYFATVVMDTGLLHAIGPNIA